MKLELKKLFCCAITCVVFSVIILLFSALLLRTTFLESQKAFLYRLLVIDVFGGIICAFIVAVIHIKQKSVLGLSFSTNILCLGIAILFVALFLSLGPTTIERSYTIYSLADMSEHSDTIYSAEDIKTKFIQGYIEEANESQKRIDEQVYIGNLEEVTGGYQITEKGRRLIKLFRVIEMIFPVPDKNSIYPNWK